MKVKPVTRDEFMSIGPLKGISVNYVVFPSSRSMFKSPVKTLVGLLSNTRVPMSTAGVT